MKDQKKYLGTRHLRVGLEISDRRVKITSIRMVEQPVVPSPVLSRNMAARIDLGGMAPVIESFDDPRIDVGVYHKNEGHTYILRPIGKTHISIPFTSVDDLLSLQVSIASVQNAIKEYDYDHLVRFFEKPPGKTAVHRFSIEDLRAHPHWGVLFGNTDVRAEAGRFEIYIDSAKEYRWRLRRPDGAIVADSGEGYRTQRECENDLQWLRGNASKVPVVFLQ
jgi:uncharacterized protein YegP (UPF0339 family)